MHGPQRPLGRDVAPEGEPRVQGGGRGLAPAEEILPALAGHAEQVGDDQDRELGGVGGDQVDGPRAGLERVEELSAVRRIIGSEAAVARGVNARLTRRRNRVWSGGSTTSIDGGSATPVASSSSPNSSAQRIQPGAAERSQPTPKDSERSTSWATACDVVTSPRLPGTSGPCARSCSCTS